MTLNLEVLPGNYVICRFEPGTSVPEWARGELVSVTRTPDELSIVCRDEEVPADVQCEPGWRCLRIAGTLDFSLVGVIARITTVLAETGVSVLAISTFDTDYFLVRDMERGAKALLEAGFLVSNPGESRPAT